MKRLLLGLLLFISSLSFGQEYVWRIINAPGGVTATGNTAFVNIGSTGTFFPALSWTTTGSPTCSIQVDKSTDGTTVSGQLVAAQNCATSGSIIITSGTTANFARVSYTITGSGRVTFTARGCINDTCTSGGGGGGTGTVQQINSGTGLTGGPVTTTGTLSLAIPVLVTSGGSGVTTITGLLKGNGTSAFTAAVAADVTGLFSGTCNSSTFVYGNGSCAALPGTVVQTNASFTYNTGSKQIFQSSGTTAGVKFTGVSADPSGAGAGDIWFRTDLGHISFNDGTSNKQLMTTVDTVSVTQLGGAANSLLYFNSSPALANLNCSTGTFVSFTTGPICNTTLSDVGGTLTSSEPLSVPQLLITGAWSLNSPAPASNPSPVPSQSGWSVFTDGFWYVNVLGGTYRQVVSTPGCTNGQTLIWDTSLTPDNWSCSTPAGSWSGLTNPTANLSLTMGTNVTTFTWAGGEGGAFNFNAGNNATQHAFTFAGMTAGDGVHDLINITCGGVSDTGGANCLHVNNGASSSYALATIATNGDTNGIQVTSAGNLIHLGSAFIDAQRVNNLALPTSAAVVGTNSSNQIITATVTGTGSTVVLQTSPTFTTPKVVTINDANGNPFIKSSATTSAVDSILITNAATANPATVQIGINGTDTNVNLELLAKGSGTVEIGSTSAFIDASGNLTVVSCTGCGGGGAGAWSGISNPSGNLALSMGTNTSTFNFSANTADAFKWANNTASTSSVSQSSPFLTIAGTYWNGTASAVDSYTINNIITNGSNGATALTIGHSGTTGLASLDISALGQLLIPGGSATNPSIRFASAASNTGWLLSGTTIAAYQVSGTVISALTGNGLSVGSARQYGWSSTTGGTGTVDTTICRQAAGVLEIGSSTGCATTGNLQLNLITKYNGNNTVDLGLAPIMGKVASTSQTAAISTTTLLTSVANDALYRVSGDVDCHSSSAAATVSVTIGWTDTSNTAQTQTTSTAVCTTLGSSSFQSFTFNIQSKASTTITYATTIVNTPTYDLRVTGEQLTSN